jgi:hypothetical protein
VKRAISVSLLVYGSILAAAGVFGHLANLGAKPVLPILIGMSGAVSAVCGGLMLGRCRCQVVAEYALGLGLYALAMQAVIGWRTATNDEAHRTAILIGASVLATASLGMLVWLFESPPSASGATPAPAEPSEAAARGHPPA